MLLHIYHHYNFQGAVNPIIGDNNIQSSKTRDIILSNNTNTNIKNQNTTQQPAKKWISDLIIGLIITVIGGLIVWYLTK